MTGAAAAAGTVAAPQSTLGASANTPVNGHATHAPVTTAASTVTVVGGTGPYSYLWSRTDAGTSSWAINTPTAQSTVFINSSVADESGETATFHCRVTDAVAAVAYTNDVEANATARSTIVGGGGGPYP